MMEVPDAKSESPALMPGAEQILSDLRWLRGLARALVRTAPELAPSFAEDAAQEVWVVAEQKRARLPGAVPRPWLAQVLRFVVSREARNVRRRRLREARVARREALPSTEAVVAHAEVQSLVVRAVLELEEPLRSAILLRFQEGLKPSEIAERQATKVDTVRWRIRRGLELLRKRIDACGSETRSRLAALASLPHGAGVATSTKLLDFAALGALAAPGVWMSLVTKWTIGCLACAAAVLLAWTVVQAGDVEPVEAPLAGLEKGLVSESKEPVAMSEGTRVAAVAPAGPNGAASVSTAIVTGRLVAKEDARRALRGRVELRRAKPKVEALADARGVFRLELEAGACELEFSAGRHRAKRVLRFADAKGDYPALQVGVRDLGAMELASAGAIRGVARRGDGGEMEYAIFGARKLGAIVDGKRVLGQLAHEASGPDGVYLIPSLAPGRYRLESMQSQSRIDVREVDVIAGRDTVVDLIFAESPRISGRALDAKGEPVKGLRLDMSSYSYIDGSTTDVQGRFVCFTGSDGPKSVRLLDTEEWGLDVRYENGPYLPGAEDVVVRVVSKRKVERGRLVQVVDAVTGEPVELFGIDRSSAPEPGARPWMRPKLRRRKRGFARVELRGSMQYFVRAKGYADAWGQIPASAPEPFRIALVRPPSLRGRVLLSGAKDAVGVRVRPAYTQLLKAHRKLGDKERLRREDLYVMASAVSMAGYTTPYMVTTVDGRPPSSRIQIEKRAPIRVELDRDGRFHVEGLERRRYRVEVLRGGELVAQHDTARLDVGRCTDVGVLREEKAATIKGRIVAGPDAPLVGCRVILDGDAKASVTTDAAGSFEFSRVFGRDHYLVVEPSKSEKVQRGLEMDEFHFVLAPGQKREDLELRIDVPRLLRVACAFVVEGAPAPDKLVLWPKRGFGSVNLQPEERSGPAATMLEYRGRARAAGEYRLDARIGGLNLRWRETLRLPRPSAERASWRFERRLQCAPFTIEKPAASPWPGDAWGEVSWKRVSGSGVDARRSLRILQHELYAPDSIRYRDGALRFDAVPVGIYKVTLKWRSEGRELVWYDGAVVEVRRSGSNRLRAR